MQHAVLDFKGLYTYANPLGQQSVPGSCSIANNVNGDEIGICTMRRGFDYYTPNPFPISSGYITKLFSYDGKMCASYNGGNFAIDFGGHGNFLPFGTMTPPTDGFIHQMLAGGNSYFTTANGVYKISIGLAYYPHPAGAPMGLDTELAITSIIASGFLSAQSQCAYQIVWGYVDESDLQIVGAPSYSVVVANTNTASPSNNVNVDVKFTIPPEVAANSALPWFYQIYRTPNTGSLTVPPGNNFQLVAQDNPTSGDYTNKYITFADTVLDSLLGASLYTASGQTDVGNPYNQPPLARDMAYFNSMAFYANYSTLQNVYATLTAVGATDGIQPGDTFTITDSVSGAAYIYTGGAANDPATRTFKVDTAGTPAQNIENTARNLALVVNRDPNNSLYIALYTSSYNGLPGQLQFFAQNLSQSVFYLTSSRTTCWSPTIPASGTTYASANVVQQNGIFISQVSKPESVPPAFLLNVGSPNYPITRLIPVRTALIVVKAGEGIFQITGTSPQSLTVTWLDTTSFIRGGETLVPLNNSGYFMTTQGVMLVNESGCEIMSRNIQGDLLTLTSSEYYVLENRAFAVGYQSDNAYLLFLQKNVNDEYAQIEYRYNWITQAWTMWDIPATAAVVNPADDCLYIATPEGYILKERKSFTTQDFADPTEDITISTIGTDTLTLVSSLGIKKGDIINQVNGGVNYTALVLDNDQNGLVTVSTVDGFQVGAAFNTSAINATVTFQPTNCNYPAFIKKFSTWNFAFNNIEFQEATVTLATDFYLNGESCTLTPRFTNTWGTFPWGTVPWGQTDPSTQEIPTYATKNTAVGHWATVSLNVCQAYCPFSLCGYSVFYNFLGERSR